MNILLTHRVGGAFGYITDGWVNALRDRGHSVIRWDGNIGSWRQFQPDLYLGCSGHPQPIPLIRKAKVAIHVNPYGPVDLGNINENSKAMEWTVKQKPDAVYGYGFESDRIAWSYWTEKSNIKWIPMPTAADSVIFKKVEEYLNRANDVVYLGGRWTYKGITIDKYLKPVLTDSSITSELYGWGDWWSGASKGILPEDQANSFLNTGKIGPCISELHTQKYGIDIPERCWKIAATGGLVVHDAVPTLQGQFNSCLISEDPSDFKSIIQHYIANPDEAAKIAETQHNEVMASHTYHHRLSHLLSELGFEDAANSMLD